jgi:hypothetical protein
MIVKKCQKKKIKEIPNDVWAYKIIQYFDYKTIENCSLVCKNLRWIIKQIGSKVIYKSWNKLKYKKFMNYGINLYNSKKIHFNCVENHANSMLRIDNIKKINKTSMNYLYYTIHYGSFDAYEDILFQYNNYYYFIQMIFNEGANGIYNFNRYNIKIYNKYNDKATQKYLFDGYLYLKSKKLKEILNYRSKEIIIKTKWGCI